jgi:hypothetical protein
MTIVKYTLLGIVLLAALLFRKTIVAVVKKLCRTVTALDLKGAEKFNTTRALVKVEAK